MKNTRLYCFGLLLFPWLVTAQPSDHVWLETSQLKVRINADGRLFCDDEKGAFLVPNGDTVTTLMRGASIWFGGFDPGLNLCLSAQISDSLHSDFAPGFRGIPSSGKVWKVTRKDIEAHLNDYADNWTIDQPNPAIFAWPGKGNPYFFEYNGFELPDSVALDGNYNYKEDNRYNPRLGDFPEFIQRYWDWSWKVPTEMAFFALHTDHPRLLTGAYRPLPVQIWVTVAVFDCPQSELLSRSVFVMYRWMPIVNQESSRWDSSFVSVLNDFEIGDPHDDYHGFLPNRSTYFAYNADDHDEIWGTNSPMMFVNCFIRPKKPVFFPGEDYYGYTIGDLGMMPLLHYNESTTPPGARLPTLPNEYYNYASGSWRDGTPLTPFGYGYNPWNGSLPRTNKAFPGIPDDSTAWTELTHNTVPGNRRGLLNHELGTVFSGVKNEMVLQYFYVPWRAGTYAQRISDWGAEKEDLLDVIRGHNSSLDQCKFEHPRLQPIPPAWQVFPNPATQVVRAWNTNGFLSKMQLFDIWGRLVGESDVETPAASISVQHLPNGVYILHMETHSGLWKTVKVVVARP